MSQIESDISLEELAHQEWLSVRSVNICLNAGLYTFNQILSYYNKTGTFQLIRNCGRKSEIELLRLCEKYKIIQEITERKEVEEPIIRISELSPFKKAILNRHIEYLICRLSVRAQNGLMSLSDSNDVKVIIEKLFSPKFDFKKLKNIGDKTADDLNNFKAEISNFIEVTRALEKEQLSKEYAKLILKENFNDLPNNFDSQFEGIFDSTGKIKLFYLLKILIDSNLLFESTEKKLFNLSYSNSNSEDLNNKLESIAIESNLTRERVRQIKALLEVNLESYFLFISNFIADDFVNYEIDTSGSCKVVDNSFVEKVNKNEEVDFNLLFYTIILGLILKKTHSILGNIETLNGKKKTKRSKQFQCRYLIGKPLFEIFSYETFIEDINSQLEQRITQTYSLQFTGYLYQFLKEEHTSQLNDIKVICETIILNEFDLIVNLDGYLLFEKNTKKLVHEYAFEILEATGTLMKVEDISKAINEKYVELETSEQSVRASLQRERGNFIYFGRSSTYGLRKWEKERENLKGGTIRNIVEEFLQESNTPRHISEILSYILKYRNTNKNSVLTNIELDDNKRFQFFDGDFVGLKVRIYGPETLSYKRVIGRHFTTKMLAKLSGLDFERVIEHYVSNYGYLPIQVRYLLEKKVVEGGIQITLDNKLKV